MRRGNSADPLKIFEPEQLTFGNRFYTREGRGMGNACYVVGSHETFPFRASWLKKGYDAVEADGFAFQREDAVVRLGVGKNMVRSIRFWCLATQVVQESNNGGREGRPLRSTKLGKKLLADDGWDPYLEDSASLWLLQWLLVTNPLRASAWWHIFANYPDNEFTKQRLTAFLRSVVEEQQQNVSPASIARDVECFVRTYTRSAHFTSSPFDASFECPLAELELICPLEEDGLYRFHTGWKEGLPFQVVGFALLQFFRVHAFPRRSVHLQDCLYTAGSPGQAFRLNEHSLLDAIDKLAMFTQGRLDVTETAGVAQVFLQVEDPDAIDEMAMALLDNYYARGGGHGA